MSNCVCLKGKSVIVPYSYSDLTGKPTLNGVVIDGDKTASDYGLASQECCESSLVAETAEGGIASFTDGAPLHAKSVLADFSAEQNLNGYLNPWCPGGGKNKFNQEDFLTLDDWTELNGVYTGMSNELTDLGDIAPDINLSGVRIAISFDAYVYHNLIGAAYLYINYTDNTQDSIEIVREEWRHYTKVSDASKTVSSIEFDPIQNVAVSFKNFQVAVGTSTSYAPYTNICPITGHDSVTAVVCKKNLMYTNVESQYINGLTFTQNADMSVTVNGIADADVELKLSEGHFIMPRLFAGEHYYLNLFPESSSHNLSYTITFRDAETNILTYEMGTWGSALNPTDDVVVQELKVKFNNGSAFYNEQLKPQLEKGTSATTYEKFNGTAYTIDLGDTYYGGTVDLQTGELTVTHAITEINGSSSFVWDQNNGVVRINISGGIITNGVTQYNSYTKNTTFRDKSWAQRSSFDGTIGMYYGLSALYVKYSEITSVDSAESFFADTPTKVIYKLAIPQTIQLDPVDVIMLYGDNNVWADTGGVTVNYFADTLLYLQKILSE